MKSVKAGVLALLVGAIGLGIAPLAAAEDGLTLEPGSPELTMVPEETPTPPTETVAAAPQEATPTDGIAVAPQEVTSSPIPTLVPNEIVAQPSLPKTGY